MEDQTFQQWAVVEMMGHRRMAGLVTEQELFGVGMLRIDVPGESDAMITQFYSPTALYSLTPVTEQVARAYAAKNYMRPISTFDLAIPTLIERPSRASADDYPSDNYTDDDDQDDEDSLF